MAEEIIKFTNGEPAHNYSYHRELVSCSDIAVKVLINVQTDAVGEQGISVVL